MKASNRCMTLAAGAAVGFTLCSVPLRAEPGVSAELSVEFFYDELEPYGQWVSVEDYGWAWTPRGASPDWRPYTVGHWEYTEEYGWLWVSDWDWGWAPFHYGRWVSHAHHGWIWVPGTDGGPAWVAWRSGGGHVGWAPLPPAATWEAGVGLRWGGIDLDVSIHSSSWSFVEERHILRPRLHTHFIPYRRNDVFLHTTVDSTRYVVLNGRIAHKSLSVKHIEKTLGHAVPRRTVYAYGSPASPRRVAIKGSHINVFKPKITKHAPRRAPRASKGYYHQSSRKALKTSKTTSPRGSKVYPGAKYSKPNTRRNDPGTSRANVFPKTQHHRSKAQPHERGVERRNHDGQKGERKQGHPRKGKARGSKSKKR